MILIVSLQLFLNQDAFRDKCKKNWLKVVQGGPNTLITVEESLKQMVPVLVLAVSKRIQVFGSNW